jgi:hypothetical protein
MRDRTASATSFAMVALLLTSNADLHREPADPGASSRVTLSWNSCHA